MNFKSVVHRLLANLWGLSVRNIGGVSRVRHGRRRAGWGEPVAGLEQRTLLAAITVNSLADNTTSGDGLVTLREAIIAANTNVATDLGQTGAAGLDAITFSPDLSGTLSLTGGQMEISETVTITGNGSSSTSIDAQENSRIFDITGSAGDVTLSSLMLQNGRTTGDNVIIDYSFTNTYSGGAVRSLSSGTLTISQSTLSGNSTTGIRARGGAIFSYNGGVTVSQSTLSGNSTAGANAYGGAIFSQSGAVTISQSTLSGNSTTGDVAQGGAICAFGAVTVSQSTLSGNSTAGNNAYGGAISSPIGGNVTITNSTLSGNQVLGTGTHGGGALYFDDGDVIITNSTITGNSANIGGGIGIFNDGAGESLTIRNSIIAGNTAPTNPDFTAPANPGTNLVVQNSLIGERSGTSLNEAQVADGNGNFVGSAAGAGIINPQLGPLANNGGPTQTHALQAGSLAINSGSNGMAAGLTTDQRGLPIARISSTSVDMGAYELFTLAGPIVVSTMVDELDGNISAGDLSLREAILLANSSPGANTITFAASTNGTELNLSLGQMEISETVTITGNGSGSTSIDAQHNSRIFDITGSAGDVTLSSLMLQNGRTTGNNVNHYYYGLYNTHSGGAVRSLSTGTLTISQSTLSGNSTTGYGAQGGAIFSHDGAVTISQSTLSGNSTVEELADGGAIFSKNGDVTVSQSILSGNSTAKDLADGGAIGATYGNVTISQSTLSGNSTAGPESPGGAIGVKSGNVTVSQSTLSGNSTSGDISFGGAISSPRGGNVTITNSTLSGNQVLGTGTYGGGALYFDDGDVIITNSTITGNSANIGGGIGIFNDGAGESLTIRNSIIAGNTAPTNPDFTAPANPGTNLVVQNSLIGNNSGTTLTATVGSTPDANGNFIGGAGASAINPQLGPLANNGGPTQTRALLANSLAINTGSNALATDPANGNAALTTDQRGAGFGRNIGGTVDMGAVERSLTATITMSDTALRLTETSLVTFSFNFPASNFTVGDLTIPNGTLTGLATSNGGLTYTATFTPNNVVTDTTNVIVLNNVGITDSVGNPGNGTTSSPNFTIDTRRPTVVITMSDTALRLTETSLVTFSFSERVTNFDNTDLIVPNGTLSPVTTANAGLTWTATFTPTNVVTDPTNVITLKSGFITDLAGNVNSGATNSPNFTIDTRRPTVVITLSDTALRLTETSLVTFAFSEAVTNFDNTDLIIPNGTLTPVATANAGLTWTATFTPTNVVTDPTNVITLKSGFITDLAGNVNAGATVSPNFTIDTRRPTVTITMADTDLRGHQTSLVTFAFSEAVTNFDNTDLIIPNGTLSPVTTANGGLTWTATFTPTLNITDPTNVITLKSGFITDLAGNVNAGATSSPNFAIETHVPTLVVTMSDTALKLGDTALVTFSFNQIVTGFANADITVPNGTLTVVTSADGGQTFTGTFTPTSNISDTTNLITVNNLGYTNSFGNTGVGTTSSPNYVVDTRRPTVVITMADTALLKNETSLVTFTFSEAITGFTNSDLVIQNGTLSTVTTSNGGLTWTALFTPTNNLNDATNIISLNKALITDLAGNAGSGTTNSPNYTINTL